MSDKQLQASWSINMEEDLAEEHTIKDGGWIRKTLANDIVGEIDADVINEILKGAGMEQTAKAEDVKYYAIDKFLDEPFTLNLKENIVVINGAINRYITVELAGPMDGDDCMVVIKVESNKIMVSTFQKIIGSNNSVHIEKPKFAIPNSGSSDSYIKYFNKILAAIEDKTGTSVGILFNDKVTYISP